MVNSYSNSDSALSGISLWGHRIVLDGASGIKCLACDKQEELPELLSPSSDFRQAVYKMYLLGKFRNQSCNREELLEQADDLHKNVDPTTRKNHQVDPNNIYWSGNGKESLENRRRF